jgi:hypothetical protein
MIASKLLVNISIQEQELFCGGADFDLSNTYFAEKTKFSLESTASNPLSNTAFTLNLDRTMKTAAQNLLGLGTTIPENITALFPSLVQV